MTIFATPEVQSEPKGIRLTPNALEHVKELRDRQNKDLALRVGVRQGGCSGMSYIMTFEDDRSIQSSDRIFEIDDLKVVCDPKSLSCLDGLIMDYSYNTIGIGGEFHFINPQATLTCCCGQSFSNDEITDQN
jgi:iron-sulfur cluster assembly protein